jgi:hypothetical protein
MAVGLEGATLGMAWDPNQTWRDGQPGRGLQALFASPDFLTGQAASRMALSLPTVEQGVEENAREGRAVKPLLLHKGQTLRLRCRIFAGPATDAADAAALGWTLSPPPPMPVPTDLRERAIRLCLRAYTQELWVPEAKGWRMHLPRSF